MTFVIGSYRAVEQPGAGHRATVAGLWRGEDLRSGDEVALTVLPVECAGAVEDVMRQVEGIRHPHLLPVVEVVTDDERVALICPWPRGGRLRELVVRRGRLTVGETLTVLIPLASALAAAHAQGERHGGVCPEAVWFDALGRPSLGALAASRAIIAVNAGLPAGSRDVAPEVVRGERVRRGPVTPTADIFSLGSVALQCLTGRSAWPADDPADVLVQSAAGLWPQPPADAGPPELLDLVRAMLQDEADRRPSAADVARQLAQVADPEPIRFGAGPAPTPASADRWRGWSGQQVADATDAADSAEPEGPDETPADDRPVPRRPGRPAPVLPDGAPRRRPPDPAERSSRARPDPRYRPDSRPRPLARARIAVLCGMLVTLVALQVVAWRSGWDDPGSAAIEPADPAPADPGAPNWPDVVAGLDAARGRALAAADAGLLDEVYLPGSPSAQVDRATIEQLAGNGWRVLDGVHQIGSVSTDDPGDAGADPVRVVVVDTLPSHQIVDATGHPVGLTPGRGEQRRVLLLTRTDGGYRISGIDHE